MAIQGSYRINFTDPKNGSFVIEPYTVNGTVTPTSDILHQKATRANTSLQLPGQYTPNYGEMVHEDLVHLLEHFAGDHAPTNAVEGQVWYDTGDSYNIVDLIANGVVVSGNQSTLFSDYISTDALLVAWYGPVSTVDNSYNSINFKATTFYVDSDNNTVITVTAEDGTELTFPNNAVGGYITVAQASRRGRLKVASVIQGTLQWVDAVSVIASDITPRLDNQQDGDLWFDTGTLKLKVSLGGEWKGVTDNYLPLSGGTLTGPLSMGVNQITFTGPVNAGNVLTNKDYVDLAIATAVEPLEEGTTAGLEALTTRVVTIEGQIPQKVNKTGDNVSGALVFGANGTTTVLSAGIDMNNRPIVKPSITWDAGDYLVAAAETNNVPDKKYIAQALSQHLQDAIHGGKAFIVEQPDGTGRIIDSLFFTDSSKTLSWDILGNKSGVGLSGSNLVLFTSDLLGASVEVRKVGSPTGDPLFKISDSAARSWNSLYIHDGQPQPGSNGAATDQNEDTKAATKGFVTDAINNLSEAAAPVTSATFSYNVTDIEYPLTLVRSGGDDIVVDINHKHTSARIDHTYVPLVDWVGGYFDLVGQQVGGLPVVSVGAMLTSLNDTKAPIRGAKFVDAPQLGGEVQILDIKTANNSFCLVDPSIQFPDGYTVTIIDPDDNVAEYTIESHVDEDDPYGSPTTYYLVTPTLPVVADITKDLVMVRYGTYVTGDVRQLVNLATMRHDRSEYVADTVPTIVAPLIDDAIEVATNAAKRTLMIDVGDETTPITLGLAKKTFRMPHAMVLTELRGSLTIAQASGTIFTVDVKQNGITILSTKLTIDNTEKTSKTATDAPVISVPNLVDDGEITIDVSQVGNGTAAGLKLVFIGHYS